MKTNLSDGTALPTAVPDAFFNAYVEAALWSSTYETEDRDDNPMDDGEHELAPEARDAMLSDCAQFLSYCEETGIDPFPEGESLEQSGQDFWLTRNGHGVGYWDRGLADDGKALTDAAHTFGECWLYVGDDGLIYQQ